MKVYKYSLDVESKGSRSSCDDDNDNDDNSDDDEEDYSEDRNTPILL